MKIRFNNLTAIASMILLLANISMPLLAEQKYDEGLFWKIEKDGQFVGHIFGTLHMNDARINLSLIHI